MLWQGVKAFFLKILAQMGHENFDALVTEKRSLFVLLDDFTAMVSYRAANEDGIIFTFAVNFETERCFVQMGVAANGVSDQFQGYLTFTNAEVFVRSLLETLVCFIQGQRSSIEHLENYLSLST